MWFFSTPETLAFLIQLLAKELDAIGVPNFLAQIIFLGKIPGTSVQITFTQIMLTMCTIFGIFLAQKIVRNPRLLNHKFPRLRH